MALKLFMLFGFGAIIRIFLINSTLKSVISDRVEVSTPLNSWHRVKEGAFLYSKNVSVYSGGVYHGSPVELLTFTYILREWSNLISTIFVLLDLGVAFILYKTGENYVRWLLDHQDRNKDAYFEDSSIIIIPSSAVTTGPTYVAAAYLFSPYSIASCIAHTSTVYGNLFLAASLLALVKDKFILFGVLNAVSTYQSLYPIAFLIPGMLHNGKFNAQNIMKVITAFSLTISFLIWASSKISNSWEFLGATYGFILLSPDLTPNIGLFWYFFTEMFEHFRLFFLATFQINAFVYVLPLTTKLQGDKMLLTTALLTLSAVFRSYPCLGDVAFYMALLPLWSHLYSYMRQTFLVGCMIAATSVLGPIMYNLWMFNGSANANFYFAVTLAFNTAQIFLVTDLLFAQVKRQYHLYKGLKMEIDGDPATLTFE